MPYKLKKSDPRNFMPGVQLVSELDNSSFGFQSKSAAIVFMNNELRIKKSRVKKAGFFAGVQNQSDRR
jgi:hypothetical protein